MSDEDTSGDSLFGGDFMMFILLMALLPNLLGGLGSQKQTAPSYNIHVYNNNDDDEDTQNYRDERTNYGYYYPGLIRGGR